jgi:hypothetical protein
MIEHEGDKNIIGLPDNKKKAANEEKNGVDGKALKSNNISKQYQPHFSEKENSD